MAMEAEQRRKQPLLSAVIPFLNEEECIPALIAELDDSLTRIGIGFELVLVDDGSRDRSVAVAKEELSKRPQITATIISLSRNFGKEAALTAGLEAANGDVVVPLDADLQDPPSVIEGMLASWREGYDVVYGLRNAGQLARGLRRCLWPEAEARWRKQDEAFHRLWLLPAHEPVEQNTNPRRYGRLQANGSLCCGCTTQAARTQSVHEGPVRLGWLSTDRALLRPRSTKTGSNKLELLEALELRT